MSESIDGLVTREQVQVGKQISHGMLSRPSPLVAKLRFATHWHGKLLLALFPNTNKTAP